MIHGHWKQVSGPKGGIAVLNSIYLECSKTRRVCEENRAEIYTPEEHRLLGLLENDAQNRLWAWEPDVLQILSWSSGTLVAPREAPAADIDLKISTTDQTAERSFRETRARGSETANPNVWRQYVLE